MKKNSIKKTNKAHRISFTQWKIYNGLLSKYW